jgi:predicted TIM-barrel fold metal-dependent hydrolase
MNMRRREFVASVTAGLLASSGTLSRVASAQEAAGTAVRGLKGPFRVIDVHLHSLNTSAPNLSAAAKNYYPPDATVEGPIRKMDEAGVDHGFLLTYSAEDLAAEIRWRKVNPVELKPMVNRAYQIDAWRSHRDRFWLFVNHSNPLRETFAEDLRRDFDEGAVGWKFMPLFYGFLADHPGFLPAYEICRRRRCPIILDLSNWHIFPTRPSFGHYPLYNELPERQTVVKSFDDYARLLDPIFRVRFCSDLLSPPRHAERRAGP